MKITKRQLRRIISEEKQKLVAERRAHGHGSGNVDDPTYWIRMALKRNPNASRDELEEEVMINLPAYRDMDRDTLGWRRVDKFLNQKGIFENRQLNEEEVDPAEFLYGEVDAMYLAAKRLREQLNELEDQMRDVIYRIPGRAMPKSRKAVMLNALILAADALDDLERHFYEAYDKMGGRGQL